MTEDDTFNMLRRTPLKKLQDCMTEDAPEFFEGPIYDTFSDFEVSFLHRHGWTVLEFKRAWVEQSLIDNPEIVKYNWWPEFIQSLK